MTMRKKADAYSRQDHTNVEQQNHTHLTIVCHRDAQRLTRFVCFLLCHCNALATNSRPAQSNVAANQSAGTAGRGVAGSEPLRTLF